MSTVYTAPATTPTEGDAPDVAVIHLTFVTVEDYLEWNMVPGTAFCGFVFTTANSLGDPFGLPVETVKKHCVECDTVLSFMQRMAGGY